MFEIPDFLYPSFCSDINPYADEIQNNTLQWAAEYGMLTEKVQKMSTGFFASRTYPKASKNTLQIAADWILWLFLLDDEVDEAHLGQEPERLYILHSQLLSILRGSNSIPQDWGIAHMLANWRERVCFHVSQDWMERFSHMVALYFESNRWEAKNRQLGIVPEVENYIAMRNFSGAVYPCFALIEITAGIELPFYILQSAVGELLQRRASNIISWSNDVFSFQKEIKHLDVHNLVYVLHKHRNISLESALTQVKAMHDTEVKKFEQLLLDLPTYNSPQIQEHFSHFVKGLQYWITGNRDWSVNNPRYQSFEVVEV
jgi:hypothetical protein